MKIVLSFVILLLFTAGIYAQGINYKALIKDDTGNVVATQPITIQFQILQGAGMTNVYQETHTPTTDANGIIIINIGEGTTGVIGDFSAIDWGIDSHFLNTQIEIVSGTGLVNISTTGFKTVPYTLHASNGLPGGGTVGQILQIDANGIAVWEDASVLRILVYEDEDGDGYGNSNNSIYVSSLPICYVTDNTDCDDTDSNEFPGQTWYIDADGDGYVDSSAVISCLRPTNGFLVSELTDAYSIGNEVGQYKYGGVVFWVDPADNNRGLVCAVSDQSSSIHWWNGSFITTGATGTAIGTGSTNTNTIIAEQGTATSYAAGLARDNPGGWFGYNDWFLPSRDELNQMWVHRAIINAKAIDNGGTAFNDLDYYWSSTDNFSENQRAYNQFFNNVGNQPNAVKSNTYSMRAVRAFVSDNSDCDDTDPLVHIEQTWYIDADGDGYGASSEFSCERPTNGFLLSELTGIDDCDDTNPLVHIEQTWYIDADGDDYGASSEFSCERPTDGFLLAELSGTGTDDCNDTDPHQFPGQIWYLDVDRDHYGGPSAVSCARPNSDAFLIFELIGIGDCLDDFFIIEIARAINPGATEIPADEVDNDCDGRIDNVPAYIGQFNHGGVVFWVDPNDNTHGLVCSIDNVIEGDYLPWIFSNGDIIQTGATDQAIGTGSANTDIILAAHGIAAPAAYFSRQYQGRGYTDWFLPSKLELGEIYNNNEAISVTSIINGGTRLDTDWLAGLSDHYWSSSEDASDEDYAFLQNFNNGAFDSRLKYHDKNFFVRAVRAF